MSRSEKFFLLCFILGVSAAYSLPLDARLVDHWPLVVSILVNAVCFILLSDKSK